MSEPTIRPIWTPEDARQAARDAAFRGVRIPPERDEEIVTPPAIVGDGYRQDKPQRDSSAGDEPTPLLPFRRDVTKDCPSCWAWPMEQCEPTCLSRLSPEDQIAHRNAVVEATLAELDRIEALPDPVDSFGAPVGPEPSLVTDRGDGRHRAGMRPRRALLMGRLLIVLAVLVLVGTVAVLWATGVAR